MHHLHAGRYRKEKKDTASTFSADSGNVHDFQESVGEASRHVPKSKSVPECVDPGTLLFRWV